MKLGCWWILLGMALVQPVMAQESGIARIDRILPATAAQQADQKAGLFSEREFQAPAEEATAENQVIGNGEWRLQPRAGLDATLLLVYLPYRARVSVLDRSGGTPVA